MAMNWQFDTRNVDEDIGWNNPLITSFKNNRLKSLTCEILQNSLDNPDGSENPVKIIFNERSIPTNSLPDTDGLSSHISACCSEETLSTQSEDSRSEILKAEEIIKSDKIQILEISDFNTTGMEGPDIKSKPFHSYIKTEGNAMGGEARGGAHGHGKAAPLALSQLRSILISTAWKDENNRIKKLFQGRSTLMTHQFGGQNFDFKGYLGNTNFRAVEMIDNEYSWLAREDSAGTTIRLLGWSGPKCWQEIVIGYAIAIYFSAIIRGKLELEVGKYKLNSETLNSFFNNDDFLETIEKNDQTCFEDIELARWFTQCLDETDPSVISDEKQITRLGRCQIKLIIHDEAPRKFGILRNNILITTSLSTFYKRHPSHIKKYVGLFECLDEKGYKLLRRMEPPQHNDFTADMLHDADRDNGSSALRNLGNGLKDALKKHAQLEIDQGSSVAWMADFFGDPAGDGQEVDDGEDIDPAGNLIFTPKPKSPPPPKALWEIDKIIKPDDDDEEPEDEDKDEDEDDDKRRPPPRPPVEDPRTEEDNVETTTETVEKTVSDVDHTRFVSKTETSGTLIIRASEAGLFAITFWEVGADVLETLEVKSLEGSILNGGKRLLSLEKGVNKKQVIFHQNLLGGIKTVLSKV